MAAATFEDANGERRICANKCLKLISLKLTVRATVIALKLQIYFARTHDNTKVNGLTSASEMLFRFIELHYFG